MTTLFPTVRRNSSALCPLTLPGNRTAAATIHTAAALATDRVFLATSIKLNFMIDSLTFPGHCLFIAPASEASLLIRRLANHFHTPRGSTDHDDLRRRGRRYRL